MVRVDLDQLVPVDIDLLVSVDPVPDISLSVSIINVSSGYFASSFFSPLSSGRLQRVSEVSSHIQTLIEQSVTA